MGSNNFGITPFVSFSVPPPNFKSVAPQNWKPTQLQSQSNIPTHTSTKQNIVTPLNHHMPSKITNSSVQNSSASAPTSHNSVENKQFSTNLNSQNSLKHEQVPSLLNSLMSIPPPPPPYFLPNQATPMVPATPMVSATPPGFFIPNTPQYNSPAARYSAGSITYPSPPTNYSPVAESYSSNSSSYYTPPPPPLNPNSPRLPGYFGNSPQGYLRNNYYMRTNETDIDLSRNVYKRRNENDIDNQRRNNRKKKKPMSQNIRLRKDWSVDDARRALEVEKEFNKTCKNHSLIIKFPDSELNKAMVFGYHPSIDNVHFQQSSTPRYCFVTLKDNINVDEVIEHLNKIPFGQGFLTAEFKKDREEDINIGPEDIDPLTLYVGNLAQEVVKEDMVKIYPKYKRIDIGFAKKMKYTRYAFISFKTVEDSIEAFKQTHSRQFYNKSLIVRFRRLHGTVGMPGEPKPQFPQKSDSCTNASQPEETSDSNSNQQEDPDIPPWEMVDVSAWNVNNYHNNRVKQEPDSLSEDEGEEKIQQHDHKETENMMALLEPFPQPKIIKEESPIKKEFMDGFTENHEGESIACGNTNDINVGANDKNSSSDRDKKPERLHIKAEPKEKKMSTYQQLILLNSAVKKMPPVEVKQEKVDLPETEETIVTVKAEPNLEDENSNDGDQDNSSGDEFNFNTLLSKLEKKKQKKKLKDIFL